MDYPAKEDPRAGSTNEEPRYDWQFTPPAIHIPDTRDLRVEIILSTPDGRRIAVEEGQEYELKDGFPENYEFDDVTQLLERAYETIRARVDAE